MTYGTTVLRSSIQVSGNSASQGVSSPPPPVIVHCIYRLGEGQNTLVIF